jgi:hypothetical protein
MFFAFVKRLRLWALLAGVGSLALAALPAHAQYYPQPQAWPSAGPGCPYPYAQTPGAFTPAPALPGGLAPAPASRPPAMPPASNSTTAPTTPQTPQAPQAPSPTAETTPQTTPETNLALSQEAGAAPSTEAGGAALGAGAFSATGYIDTAIPFTHFRLRYDAAYNDNRPDRAEFFYPKCGCNPGGTGPLRPETSVDYQDISGYLEIAVSDRASGFVEVPVRFLNPDQNANTAGLSDINAGFKYAVIASEGNYLTFQFRTYAPTGAGSHGLGTGHTSLEPALLWHGQMSDRFALDTEFRDWIPVGGTDFAGNVIRYGVGLSYLALNSPNFRIIPVGEVVGWTVLGGRETEATPSVAFLGPIPGVNVNTRSADGDTIVNAKVGVRFGFGSYQETGFLSGSDLYVGYGRALTGDVWYKDILRVEYRIRF